MMNFSLQRLIREPLLHFLLLGAFVFVVYEYKNNGENEAPNHIVVSKGQQQQLITKFNRTWLRSPTEKELSGLIENHVREEVFYREAVAMGLDQHDALVRQRMRMKLEFMLEDLSAQNVSDDQLIEFMKVHSDKFRIDTQLSFQQVYLNPDKRNNVESDATNLISELKNGAVADSVGDSTLLPYEYTLKTHDEIQRSLGERFTNEVMKLAPGHWTGPIYSVYGAHLIKVNERIQPKPPELAEIREQVEREYLVKKREELKILTYEKLRQGYQVTIEQLDDQTGQVASLNETDQASKTQ